MSLLEVATHLVKYDINNCIRFAWWAGEEEGLLGSDYYVSQLSDKENLKIRLFMDYDMMASPNYAYQIYDANNKANPEGSEELRELYKAWYVKNGLNYTMIPFDGRSDYDAFIRNSIPGGGIATGAEGVKTDAEQSMFGGKAGVWFDPCYHQLCDDVSNLALDAWVINTKVRLNLFSCSFLLIESSLLHILLPHMVLLLRSSLNVPRKLRLSLKTSGQTSTCMRLNTMAQNFSFRYRLEPCISFVFAYITFYRVSEAPSGVFPLRLMTEGKTLETSSFIPLCASHLDKI